MSVPSLTSPLISILMPTYNRKEWLGKAIVSVLAQTYPAWELIIIDDGSESPMEEILESLQDPRIHYHRIEHLGRPGAVRNVALSMAKGEFVFRLDDDDEMDPACLEKMISYFRETPELNALITASLFIGEDSSLLMYPQNLVRDESGSFRLTSIPPDGQITWQDVYDKISANVLPCPTMLVRRSVLQAVGGYDPTLAYWEDSKLVISLLMQGISQVRIVPLPLYYYRLHGQNLTRQDQQTTRQWIEDKWAFFDWLYALPVVPDGMHSSKQQQLEKIYLDHIPPLLSQGHLQLARELLLEAWHHPEFQQERWLTVLGDQFMATFPLSQTEGKSLEELLAEILETSERSNLIGTP